MWTESYYNKHPKNLVKRRRFFITVKSLVLDDLEAIRQMKLYTLLQQTRRQNSNPTYEGIQSHPLEQL